jgi:hypothetical protein
MRLKKTVAHFIGCAALIAGCGAAPCTHAATLNAQYSITLAGLPLGTVDVASAIEGERYQLQLQAKLTGLAGLITSGGLSAAAAGAVSGGRPAPTAFAVTSRNASEQRTVQMGLTGGKVAAVSIVPPLDDKVDRVPVNDAHKRGVVDPVSALIMPALSRGELVNPANCNRTIPVFDGAARFDIVLSYAGTQQIQTLGYAGPVLVCNVRYVPIAGHRTERPGTKFMQDNREMSVWLAPVQGTQVLAPLRIVVQTMVGMSVVEASRWTLDSGPATAPAAAR